MRCAECTDVFDVKDWSLAFRSFNYQRMERHCRSALPNVKAMEQIDCSLDEKSEYCWDESNTELCSSPSAISLSRSSSWAFLTSITYQRARDGRRCSPELHSSIRHNWNRCPKVRNTSSAGTSTPSRWNAPYVPPICCVFCAPFSPHWTHPKSYTCRKKERTALSSMMARRSRAMWLAPPPTER